MATNQFDDLLKRMSKIAEAVNAFKSETVQASAFEALIAAADVEKSSAHPKKDKASRGGNPTNENKVKQATNTEDMGEFFTQFEQAKPAENVKLIAAWLYSQYGKVPITNAKIQKLADEAGITVANRADLTMRVAKTNGKNLFIKQGNGWNLTLAGERYMKETYSVKKSNKPQPGDDE